MEYGICFDVSCQATIPLNVPHPGGVSCPVCRKSNSYKNAKERYALSAASGCTVPTPDLKMGAVSIQASPATDPAQAFKSDAGKVQFDLLEDGAPNALLEIAKVMSWAVEVKGYHPHSWQEIPDAVRRYKAALGRHRNAIARGEVHDPESGLLHWAHAACCVIFITELELRSKP